jgi:flagellar FliL protein
MNKILKISLIVVLCVALIYLIVATFFSNSSNVNSKFSGFGAMVGPSSKSSTKGTDELEVSVDRILVNISRGEFKYMKADMSFKMKDDRNKEDLENNMPNIRDLIIRFSSAQDGNALASDEGKQKYKKDIIDIIQETYGYEIQDIYFRNFVLAR